MRLKTFLFSTDNLILKFLKNILTFLFVRMREPFLALIDFLHSLFSGIKDPSREYVRKQRETACKRFHDSGFGLTLLSCLKNVLTHPGRIFSAIKWEKTLECA